MVSSTYCFIFKDVLTLADVASTHARCCDLTVSVKFPSSYIAFRHLHFASVYVHVTVTKPRCGNREGGIREGYWMRRGEWLGARNDAVPISEGRAAADVSFDPNFPFAENSRRREAVGLLLIM